MDKGTDFTVKLVRQCTHNHGIHWSHYPSHHPEDTCLKEQWTNHTKKKKIKEEEEEENEEEGGEHTM